MAKVHPLTSDIIDPITSQNASSSSKRERLTVWMKSLVMQGNGCTAYNENGQVVYRIDNYDQKNSNEVFLMDLKGKVLFTILRKKMWVFRKWEGYKSISNKNNGLLEDLSNNNKEKPLFRVTKNCRVLSLRGGFSCKVALKYDDNNNQAIDYRLEGSAGKSALRILDGQGGLVAEAKRKQSSTGVILGDDVLNLVIEASVDHSLVMALVTVYGLMQKKM
ncbi:protein LURP-one-related 4-like [Humulus lupulus]|uniref:protein LURP-one-related 4-like n=1 Tax=Humulus lupulus TaxID=3486 RepID=UPI002B401DAA|nr:protein LURP-one-related 4-like [Humulus lupulus]